MKNTLLKLVKALLYPFFWCRQTLLEASEFCCDCDPVGYVDYMNFLSSAPRHSTAPARQETHCSPCWVTSHH